MVLQRQRIKSKRAAVAVTLVLLASVAGAGVGIANTANIAKAWDGYWGRGWNGIGGGGPWWGGQGGGGGGVGYEQYQQGYQPWIDNLSPYQSGWNHGVVDAVSDHTNSLSYNNDGQCCHSPVYWSGFHDGYRSQWNTYQNTQQTVNNYVNIYGNGNEVYLNDKQNSDGSVPLQTGQLVKI
jgi:hypothetical protein